MEKRGVIMFIIYIILFITLLFVVFYVFVLKPSSQQNITNNSNNIIIKNASSVEIDECNADSGCVPASCCHPSACVPKEKAPQCKSLFCTQECKPNSLDCGQGNCSCINKICKAVLK